jgi:hypothetical protein
VGSSTGELEVEFMWRAVVSVPLTILSHALSPIARRAFILSWNPGPAAQLVELVLNGKHRW